MTQALSLPVSAPVPEEYATEFDAENPSTYGQHVDLHRSLHGRERHHRRAHRLHARQGDQDGPQPELGRRGTDFRPAYLDSIDDPGGLRPTPPRRRARSSTASATVNGDITPPPNVIKEAATEPERGGPADADPERRQPLHLAQHARSRRSTTSTSARRCSRTPTATRCATRAAASWSGPVATHFIPPEMPGLRGGRRRRRRPGARLPRQRPRAIRSSRPKYMQEGRLRERQVRGRLHGDDGRRRTPHPTRRPRRSSRHSSRSSASTSTCASSARDIMYTRFCSSPTRQPNVCPNVGWLKDFNDPPSPCSTSASTATRSTRSTTPTGRCSTIPEVNEATRGAPAASNDPDERAQAWGEVDTQITAHGARDPLGLGQPGQHPGRPTSPA